MVLFLADENFNNQIVRGVLRQRPNIDIVHVQDVILSGADDPSVLAWAAQDCRSDRIDEKCSKSNSIDCRRNTISSQDCLSLETN